MSLTEKVAVVTGAGSGIGQALAVGAASEGAAVVLYGRSLDRLQATQAMCGEARTLVVAGDVSSPRDVHALFEAVERDLGAPYVLFNCAGMNAIGSFAEIDTTQWLAALNTNLIGTALCCKFALEKMRASGRGRVINLGSRMGGSPVPGWSAYCVSKAGTTTLTRALARDLAEDGYDDILVNELIPGMTRSNMSDVGQEPSEVWPWARALACAPPASASGRSFFRGEAIDIWKPAQHDSLLARILNRLRSG